MSQKRFICRTLMVAEDDSSGIYHYLQVPVFQPNPLELNIREITPFPHYRTISWNRQTALCLRPFFTRFESTGAPVNNRFLSWAVLIEKSVFC